MTDVAGNPEEERRAEFYHQPWSQEAVSRYFYCKVRSTVALELVFPLHLSLHLLVSLAAPHGDTSTTPLSLCHGLTALIGPGQGPGPEGCAAPSCHNPDPAYFLYRSSSAGRSWSSRWLYAIPRSLWLSATMDQGCHGPETVWGAWGTSQLCPGLGSGFSVALGAGRLD